MTPCSRCGELFDPPATSPRGGRRRSRCDACRSNHAKVDGAAWRKLRRRVLAEEPACHVCGRPATQVDHVLPLALRPDLALERSNLRGICARCNARKSDRINGVHYERGTAPVSAQAVDAPRIHRSGAMPTDQRSLPPSTDPCVLCARLGVKHPQHWHIDPTRPGPTPL